LLKRAVSAVALVTIVVTAAWTADGVAESQSIIAFLNQTIVWYRQLTVQEQLATDPSDVLFLNDNRTLADQIVRQSFDFARARAQGLSTQAPAPASGGQSQGRLQNLAAIANKADQQVKELQGEIDTARRGIETATGKKRTSLEAVLAETQSEQQLQIARRDTMRSMISFASGAGAGFGGNGSLESQIEELARTVPAAVAASTEKTNGNSSVPANEPAARVQIADTRKAEEPNGILGLVTDLMALHRKSRAIEDSIASTEQLQSTLQAMRTPLIAQAKQLASQGDQIAAEPDSTDPTVLAQHGAVQAGIGFHAAAVEGVNPARHLQAQPRELARIGREPISKRAQEPHSAVGDSRHYPRPYLDCFGSLEARDVPLCA
jgi:hypothetical protein